MNPTAGKPPGDYCKGGRNPLLLLKIISLMTALIAVIAYSLPGQIRSQAYAVFREVSRVGILLRTYDMNSLESEHFVVKYQSEDAIYAGLVLDAAERFYKPVTLRYQTAPRSKIPVIMYPTGSELNASFGWSASESAMGVYWAGTIRILSPDAWMFDKETSKVRDAFINSGPMAHELTHLMVDYATRGNCPRWLTEGLAQYEEYRLTGFRFDTLPPEIEDFYRLSSLDRDFDSMPDQSLAYFESLSAVEYIIAEYGEGALDEILGSLRQGLSIDRAMEEALNVDLTKFEYNWHLWLKNMSKTVSREQKKNSISVLIPLGK